MFERYIGGERDNISLSAVLRRGNDSVNTTIFLELILVIVGETGIPGWVRSSNVLFRRQIFYPIELREYLERIGSFEIPTNSLEG